MVFRIKMFADGADLGDIKKFVQNPLVAGFTTNPTLMRKAGVEDYVGFCRQAADIVNPKPISFEVFSDDIQEMADQARVISGWGDNIFVKIPVTNTKGVSTDEIIGQLSAEGIKLNVTAIMTVGQVQTVISSMTPGVANVVSVFAGRVADTGVDPLPLMAAAKQITKTNVNAQLLWASPRELLNLIQAENLGCDIITMTTELWNKIPGLEKDLTELSLQTVKMFYQDAVDSKYLIT
jgi:transaldolase